MTQEEFGARCGLDQGQISRFELGKVAPPEATLRRMAVMARIPWAVVVHLRRIYAATVAVLSHRVESGLAEGDSSLEARSLVDAALLALTPYLLEESAAGGAPSPTEESREAEEIWQALSALPAARRQKLLELTLRASRSWALAERLCEASIQAASHRAEEAQELAELALFVAQQVPGDERWRARLEGYCLAHLANARRVATDYAGAGEAFALARKQWAAGASIGPEPLASWLLPALEASLCRVQRRFPQALALLEQALQACGEEPAARARILLNKEHVYNLMGDREAANAALIEAGPWVEAAQLSSLHFVLRFKTANNLCHLGRAAEAEALLPEIREMMPAPPRDLYLLRVHWLEAKVAAGLGRGEEARAGLENLMADFIARNLPLEAALAGLDLSLLWLESGHTAEVRKLAPALARLFQEKGIAREANAALVLFCEAAQQETATVALAQQAIAALDRVKRAGETGGKFLGRLSTAIVQKGTDAL